VFRQNRPTIHFLKSKSSPFKKSDETSLKSSSPSLPEHYYGIYGDIFNKNFLYGAYLPPWAKSMAVGIFYGAYLPPLAKSMAVGIFPGTGPSVTGSPNSVMTGPKKNP
jgi:hypothetical protein